jgi:hypothetical protein
MRLNFAPFVSDPHLRQGSCCARYLSGGADSPRLNTFRFVFAAAPRTGVRVNREKAYTMPATPQAGAQGRSKAHGRAAVRPGRREG